MADSGAGLTGRIWDVLNAKGSGNRQQRVSVSFDEIPGTLCDQAGNTPKYWAQGFAAQHRLAVSPGEGEGVLQPFLLEPLPVTLAENLVTYTMRPVVAARCHDPGCDICEDNVTAGFGDCTEALGLPSEIAEALIG